MIVGIGVDVVDINRIQRIYEKYSHKFANRIFSDEEYQDYIISKKPVDFLAKRFAVKEAVTKALGTGFSQGVRPSMIVVLHDNNGKPEVVLKGQANSVAEKLGVKHHLISVSDDKNYAVAFAVMED